MPGDGGERAAKLRALYGALLRRELIDANERDAHGLLHADDFWPLPFPAQDNAQLLLVRGPHPGFYLSWGFPLCAHNLFTVPADGRGEKR